MRNNYKYIPKLINVYLNSGLIGQYSSGAIKWSRHTYANYSYFDIGLSRNGPNTLEVNDGNVGVMATLLTGNVGIGTASTSGFTNNVLASFGNFTNAGNIYLANTDSVKGIVFSDGTFQTTANTGSSGLYGSLLTGTVPTQSSTGLTSNFNFTDTTVSDTDAGILISGLEFGGTTIRGIYKSIPTPPFTINVPVEVEVEFI